ncbi:Alkaline phosphatase [Cystobacter fuscus DSM 2262]|uniref:Alkaline phosphatase n=1 Tax=Cystobacter fuscus (strain ATCC 25194 / DSM 2262 / NBRC 100088 / M29) TaxID=1242864 RepID=S9R5B4_CYSF2|nr:metallophosphoesterase [Cystobacter fuscus]EPX64128.1 Alkaline phosphatase [Cystobacter fuscus DSM 2262]
MKRRPSRHVAGALLWLWLAACQRQTPELPPPSPPLPPGSAVLLAVGDIASCDSEGDEATAAMLDVLPGEIATLGDTVYPEGTAEAFARCYAPSWGRHKARTHPVPGNHDYLVPGAEPYFDYFGAAAGARGQGYYSYEVGAWHVVALNTELGAEAFEAQVRWLREDLKAHPARCTLAYMHRPLFTSMRARDNAFVRPLWEALYEAGAEVVLAGHDHFYERFAPQTPGGEVDAGRGLREFVVGTGGRSFYPLEPAPASSERRIGDRYGLLRLTLEEGTYGWEFLQVGGGIGDQGRGTCH